jgi:hypothetical protein
LVTIARNICVKSTDAETDEVNLQRHLAIGTLHAPMVSASSSFGLVADLCA